MISRQTRFTNRNKVGEANIFVGSFIVGLVTLLLFASYLGSVNSYIRVWNSSKLVDTSVYVDSTRSCTKSKNGAEHCTTTKHFYLHEHFNRYKNGVATNDYCSVQRLTFYPSYDSAYNAGLAKKLGTFRPIYVYLTSQVFGKCADDEILHYYRAVAWTMLSVFIVCFGICFGTMLLVACSVWLEELTEKGLQVDDSRFATATNWSSPHCFRSWNKFWYLADVDQNGKIDMSEFMTAMKLIFVNMWVSFFKNLTAGYVYLLGIIASYCGCCKERTHEKVETQESVKTERDVEIIML
jgi:hypothetical protein